MILIPLRGADDLALQAVGTVVQVREFKPFLTQWLARQFTCRYNKSSEPFG